MLSFRLEHEYKFDNRYRTSSLHWRRLDTKGDCTTYNKEGDYVTHDNAGYSQNVTLPFRSDVTKGLPWGLQQLARTPDAPLPPPIALTSLPFCVYRKLLSTMTPILCLQKIIINYDSHFVSTETCYQIWLPFCVHRKYWSNMRMKWMLSLFVFTELVINHETEVDAVLFVSTQDSDQIQDWSGCYSVSGSQKLGHSEASHKHAKVALYFLLRMFVWYQELWHNVLSRLFIVSMSCHHRIPPTYSRSVVIRLLTCPARLWLHCSMHFQQLAWQICNIFRFVMEWKKCWQQNHLPDEDLTICGSTGHMLLIGWYGSTAPSVANIEARRSHGLLYLIRANVNKLEHMILATRQHLACRKASFRCSNPISSMHIPALHSWGANLHSDWHC